MNAPMAGRRGRAPTAGAVRLVMVVGAVAALLAGCRSQRDEGKDGTSVAGGGTLLALSSMDGNREQRSLRADQFCVRAAAALSGGDLLDCQLVALGNPASTRCAPFDPQHPTTTKASDGPAVARCSPLLPSVADQAIGWTVTEQRGKRQLSVYLGPRRGADPATSPSSASAATTTATAAAGAAPASASAVMLERYRATDETNRWSELAVCPRDLDRHGVEELVVLVRPWAGPERDGPDESARPELVAAWLAPTERTSNARTPLRALRPRTDVPRAAGEGCASPAVQTLSLRNDALATDVVAKRTTTTTAPAFGTPH